MSVLKVYKSPICYMPFETSLLVILMGNDSFRYWVNSNYMQVGIKIIPDDITNMPTPNLYFVDIPSDLDINAVPTRLFDKNDFSNYVKIFIEKGYYIYAYIDKFYSPNYYNYNMMHDSHPLLIYGIENEKMYIADFFRNGKYTFENCSIVDMNRAIKMLQTDLNTLDSKEADFLLIKANEKQHEFDAKRLLKNIDIYLNGKSMFGISKTKDYDFWGMESYKCIIEYLQKIREVRMNIDYRMFSFHVSHKSLLLDKIMMLCNEYSDIFALFISEVNDMLRLCQMNQSLALKYNLNYQNTILDKMRDNILELEKKEKRVLYDLSSKLAEVFDFVLK